MYSDWANFGVIHIPAYYKGYIMIFDMLNTLFESDIFGVILIIIIMPFVLAMAISDINK